MLRLFMARREEGQFSSRDNTRLYWQSLLPDAAPQAFVGIVHGFGDHSGRYRRVMEYLVSQNYGVVAFDYRGHGKAEGKRGYCEKWEDYLDDLEVFWARLRGMNAGLPTFILAHSHGGLMACHWALRKPEGLRGLILSAPYLQLALDPPALKVLAGKLVGLAIPWLKVPTGIAFTQLSRDEAWQRESAEDPLYGRTTTPRWFNTSTAAQAHLAGRGRELTTPLLMVTAGADSIASTPASKAFFDTLGSQDKQYKEYPGMLHEMVLGDLGKEAVWNDITSWISAHR